MLAADRETVCNGRRVTLIPFIGEKQFNVRLQFLYPLSNL